MKVVVVGSYGRSLVTFRGRLLQAMAERGHEVIACAPELSADVREVLAGYGVRCRAVAMARTGMNPVADFRTFVDLFGMMRKECPDRVLAYTVKPVVYGALAARMAGVSGVHSMITGLGYAFVDGAGLRQRIVSTVVQRLYRAAVGASAGVFFQNPDDREEFLQRGLLCNPVRTVLINGSGVDVDHYARVPLPPEPAFLLIARLIGDKGVREYVEAARIVRRFYPEARFRLAGWLDSNPSAISKEELQGWIDEDIIQYLGLVDDVRPALTECRVYVLPSYYREGQPRTVLEAMSMGRPVITTDAPGCRETVQEGVNGLLVPVRDSKRLADAMMAVLEKPELAEQMGCEGRRIAEGKYDVRKVNEVILDAMGL